MSLNDIVPSGSPGQIIDRTTVIIAGLTLAEMSQLAILGFTFRPGGMCYRADSAQVADELAKLVPHAQLTHVWVTPAYPRA